MKLAVLECLSDVSMNHSGDTLFHGGSYYPAKIYKTKIVAINDLRKEHTVADSKEDPRKDKFFDDHFHIVFE
ncbi:hypothetical protein [Halobacillus litoralis]|uniref:hypothetical protein n=1 Tax=Halobacillus litoralis TaxID=45668 RepID=UPI001CD60DA2|nr:hypothetical protein [Halobacillus litoralis]MCA1021541.1 hypothetical protein [Halobacillus litoralis]